MRLRGGVIIIGSLLWDNSERADWRRTSLDSFDTRIPLKLRIRYGRESGEKRKHTYTMIFSNDQTTDYGQGFLLGFQRQINNENDLRTEAASLAQAEGIWNAQTPFLAKNWGAVGLLTNETSANSAMVLSPWQKVFNEGRCNSGGLRYQHERYAFDNEKPVIDGAGLLQIEWLPEMNDFDFVLATPTAPKPRRPLSATEIAQRMMGRDYIAYFDGNRANDINTFQDSEILDLIAANKPVGQVV